MRKLTRAAALVTAAAVGLVATGAVMSGDGDPQKQVRITAEQAVARAAAFTGDAGQPADVSGPLDGALHRLYIVDSPGAHVTVDAMDGRVISAVMHGVEHRAGPAMTAERAIKTAAAFLSSHAIDTPAGAPETQLVDRGVFQTWVVSWQGRSGAALAPDLCEVEIDSVTGDVARIRNDSRPYAPAPEPDVSEKAAIAAARKASGMTEAEADAVLRITFGEQGEQLLTWTVSLRDAAEDGITRSALVDVDAITGEAVVTGQG